jgi:hypothetical protein
MHPRSQRMFEMDKKFLRSDTMPPMIFNHGSPKDDGSSRLDLA